MCGIRALASRDVHMYVLRSACCSVCCSAFRVCGIQVLACCERSDFEGQQLSQRLMRVCCSDSMHCNALHCTTLQRTPTHCNTLCHLSPPPAVESALDARVLQCVAVCCSVLQCVAVCCSVLQCVAGCCSMLQCVAVRCITPCVAVCCSRRVLQYLTCSCNTRGMRALGFHIRRMCVAECMLQCVLQHIPRV